jgi:hypothetical protein
MRPNRLAIAAVAAGSLGLWLPVSSEEMPQMTTGNGEKNWIKTEGVIREGATFTFGEVQIDGNGWLVIHQIVDGKPVGEKYLGATYIASGESKSVDVTVEDYSPKLGEAFVVMLHRDVNENKVFDFVFVDGGPHVVDKAVFEGSKMVALTFAAP